MNPLAAVGLGFAAWAVAHAWCHARCLALATGDREGLASPAGADAGHIAAGIGRGDVSPEVAERAFGLGLISREDVLRTRAGGYRRRYDRTAAADAIWLPAFLAAAAIGAAASPAWAGMMCLSAWAAMADARFRVVPRTCAAGMILLSIACDAAAMPRPIVLMVLALAFFGLFAVLGRAVGSRFGSGDVILMASCVTALGSPGRWVPFSSALLALLLIALIASASGRRVAGRERAGRTLIPFGCFTAPALAWALAVSL